MYQTKRSLRLLLILIILCYATAQLTSISLKNRDELYITDLMLYVCSVAGNFEMNAETV